MNSHDNPVALQDWPNSATTIVQIGADPADKRFDPPKEKK